MSEQASVTAMPVRQRTDYIIILERFGVLVFLVPLIVFFAVQNIRFVSGRNVANDVPGDRGTRSHNLDTIDEDGTYND